MNRRRRLLFAVLLATPVAALVAACGFPVVTFNDGEDAGAEASTTSSSSGEMSGTDAGREGSVIVDDSGNPIEIVTRPDASLPDAAGCDARCDCDDDGYLDSTKAFCKDGGTDLDDAMAKAHGDCDDLDPLVHPDQTYSDAVPRPGSPKPGDWNCDGNVDKGYAEDFQCVGLATLCTDNGVNGKFDKTVACGANGELNDCIKGLGCTKQFREVKKQLCK